MWLISVNQEQNIFLFIFFSSSEFPSPRLSTYRFSFCVGTAEPFPTANLLHYLPCLPVQGRLRFLLTVGKF